MSQQHCSHFNPQNRKLQYFNYPLLLGPHPKAFIAKVCPDRERTSPICTIQIRELKNGSSHNYYNIVLRYNGLTRRVGDGFEILSWLSVTLALTTFQLRLERDRKNKILSVIKVYVLGQCCSNFLFVIQLSEETSKLCFQRFFLGSVPKILRFTKFNSWRVTASLVYADGESNKMIWNSHK